MKEPSAAPSEPPRWAPYTWEPPETENQPPTLIGSRCPHCHETMFPSLSVCPHCLEATEPLPLGTRGTLYAFSVVHVAPAGFATPYAIGYVDLPEGARVFAQLAVDDFALLRSGLPMALTWGPIRTGPDGRPLHSYQFRPAGV